MLYIWQREVQNLYENQLLGNLEDVGVVDGKAASTLRDAVAREEEIQIRQTKDNSKHKSQTSLKLLLGEAARRLLPSFSYPPSSWSRTAKV